MLKRCNALPLVNVPCSISVVYALPIQFVLLHLSYMEHLDLWARGDSIIKPIFLLCMWETLLEHGMHPNLMLRKMEKHLSSSQPRYMSTTACRVKNISKPLEHAQHLAYTVMKLKKGLRFL